jgi:environmental stress-induced protein Ves
MRLLPATDYRRMPWKNGGGETREIAISPADATLDTMDWRVSLATVAADGPFSVFKGVERTLCVIRGGGMQLQTADSAPIDLHVTSAPYSFDGQVATHSRLIDGPIEDLNVMSRRGRIRHSVQRFVLKQRLSLDTIANTLFVYCVRGDVRCSADLSVNLHPDDSAILNDSPGVLSFTPTQSAEIIVVEFYLQGF